jgi:predicted secreted protein
MSITTVIAIYFLVWWVTLFAVLPWGVRSQHEGGEIVPGTDPGAPAVHRVWRAMLWTTLIASVIFIILAVIYRANVIPLDALMTTFGPPRQP